MHTAACWLWCVSALSQQISGVRKEQKGPACLYLGNCPGWETLGSCLHAVAMLKHRTSWIKPLVVCASNSVLCCLLRRDLLKFCVFLWTRAAESAWASLHTLTLGSATRTPQQSQLLLSAPSASPAAPAGAAGDSWQEQVWELCCCSCSSAHLHTAENQELSRAHL